MKKAVTFVVLTLGSAAFQLSLAIWPQKLQPYAWAMKYVWLAWAAAVVLLAVMWLAARNSNAVAAAAAPASSQITFAPVITQTTNQMVTQGNASPQSGPRRVAVQQSDLEPNLVGIGTETIRMYQPISYVFSNARDAGVRGEFLAGVAIIANRPSVGRPGVASAQGVIAQLIYRTNDREIYSGFGSWADQFSNRSDFPPAQAHRLIIVIQDERFPGIVFGVTNPRSHKLPSRWPAMKNVFENSPPNDMTVIPEPAFEIEITLLEKGRVLGVLLYRCERDYENGTFKLTAASQ